MSKGEGTPGPLAWRKTPVEVGVGTVQVSVGVSFQSEDNPPWELAAQLPLPRGTLCTE